MVIIKIHCCPKPLSSNLQVPTIGFGGKEHQITLLTPKKRTCSHPLCLNEFNLAIRIWVALKTLRSNRGFMLDTSGTRIFHANPAFQPSFMLALLFPQQLVGRPASPPGHQAWHSSTGSKRSKPGWLPQCPGHRLPNRTPPSRRR